MTEALPGCPRRVSAPGSWAEFPPLALFPHSGMLFPLMAEKLDPNEIVTLEELALSNLWEVTMPVIDLP